VEPDTFNCVVLHLLANVAKVKLSLLQHFSPPSVFGIILSSGLGVVRKSGKGYRRRRWRRRRGVVEL